MAAVKPSPRSLFALLLAPCAAADSSKRRAGEATFRTGLQTVYTQAWPGGTRAHAPHLHVRDARIRASFRRALKVSLSSGCT